MGRAIVLLDGRVKSEGKEEVEMNYYLNFDHPNFIRAPSHRYHSKC